MQIRPQINTWNDRTLITVSGGCLTHGNGHFNANWQFAMISAIETRAIESYQMCSVYKRGRYFSTRSNSTADCHDFIPHFAGSCFSDLGPQNWGGGVLIAHT